MQRRLALSGRLPLLLERRHVWNRLVLSWTVRPPLLVQLVVMHAGTGVQSRQLHAESSRHDEPDRLPGQHVRDGLHLLRRRRGQGRLGDHQDAGALRRRGHFLDVLPVVRQGQLQVQDVAQRRGGVGCHPLLAGAGRDRLRVCRQRARRHRNKLLLRGHPELLQLRQGRHVRHVRQLAHLRDRLGRGLHHVVHRRQLHENFEQGRHIQQHLPDIQLPADAFETPVLRLARRRPDDEPARHDRVGWR